MAVTISPDDVRPIFDTQLNDTQLTAFCTMAQVLIDNHLASKDLGDPMLKQIGINLAAHFATMRQRQVKSETVEGNLNLSYQGQTGQGINSSFYGQTAVFLDSSKTLSNLDKQLKKPSFWVSGVT